MAGKHTPGPWRKGDWGASVVADVPIEDGPRGCDAVQHYGGHLVCESVATCNQPIIIAAPRMYQALVELVALQQAGDAGDRLSVKRYVAAWESAEAAIRKAEGEANGN